MKVFLSYAHADSEIASRLYHDLVKHGVNCWFDREELLPGERWRESIEIAIRGASYFIALLSQNSVDKVGFVQKELKIALDLLMEMPQHKIFVIPARIDNCVPSHQALMELQWVDLFNDYHNGLGRILRVIGRDSAIGLPSTPSHGQRGNHVTSVATESQATSGARLVYLEFPAHKIYKEIAEATGRVRMLATWVYGSKVVTDGFAKAIGNGCTVQILILDPDSSFASLYAEEMEFTRQGHGKEQILATLAALEKWMSDLGDAKGRVEVRVYDSFPRLVMLDSGLTIVYSPLISGALIGETPHIEVPREEAAFYSKLDHHFARLWQNAMRCF
jgi:hypothetical protein